jgi:hypothetical protein
VAHAYNPSYSGGRDQEDRGSKIICKTLSQKYPTQKRAGGVAQVVECLPGRLWYSSQLGQGNSIQAKKKDRILFALFDNDQSLCKN